MNDILIDVAVGGALPKGGTDEGQALTGWLGYAQSRHALYLSVPTTAGGVPCVRFGQGQGLPESYQVGQRYSRGHWKDLSIHELFDNCGDQLLAALEREGIRQWCQDIHAALELVAPDVVSCLEGRRGVIDAPNGARSRHLPLAHHDCFERGSFDAIAAKLLDPAAFPFDGQRFEKLEDYPFQRWHANDPRTVSWLAATFGRIREATLGEVEWYGLGDDNVFDATEIDEYIWRIPDRAKRIHNEPDNPTTLSDVQATDALRELLVRLEPHFTNLALSLAP